MKKYEACFTGDNDTVDMAYILSKFQGIETADNRCIIACTNDPDRIDSALKRKGRFDLILHLDNASPQIILDMVAHYFQTDKQLHEQLHDEFRMQLPSRILAPATVQDINASSDSARIALTRMVAMNTSQCIQSP